MSPEALEFGTPAFEAALAERFDPEVAAVVRLAAELCAIPGITVPAVDTDFPAVEASAAAAARFAREAGLRVVELPAAPEAPYPLLAVGFAENDLDGMGEAVALIGHLDVVPPREPGQFVPKLVGQDLFARGAADMKTVVASWLVWMARIQRDPSAARPPVLALLSCCEENGSAAPHHTGTMLDRLAAQGVRVRFAVVGERTGELEWMDPEPRIGPICKENRSWRWLRAESASARGLPALWAAAEAVGLGRRRIAELNATAVPAQKASRQPGVRSGFVNPFVRIAGTRARGAVVSVERPPGAAIHSAAARASDESLLERLAGVARAAVEAFGEGVKLAGVEIGQDGNFNSYDGSGRMRLRIDAPEDAVRAWMEGVETGDLRIHLGGEVAPVLATWLGIDIRELLDHREAVDALLGRIGAALWHDVALAMPSARPPWRCPADHPDLVALEAAWEAVVGAPSPDLVKLHGNDGGSLAERQQRDPAARAAGLGHAVVFGQVGMRPHGAGEFHRCTSIAPYLEVLDRWAAGL